MKLELPDETKLAIIGIVIIEGIALTQGVNGGMLVLAIAAVSGLGGYSLAKYMNLKGVVNRETKVED